MDSTDSLKDWFRRSGVSEPLDTCVGPLPRTGVAMARWSRQHPKTELQTISAHPDCYRIAVMLEPLESQVWVGDRPVWCGVIGADRFRICPPGAAGRWRQLSRCDIVNLFVPMATVRQLAANGGLPAGYGLASTLFKSDHQVLDLVWKLLHAQASAGPLTPQYCDGLVTALLCHLLEHHASVGRAEAPRGGLSGTRLRKVLSFMAENLTREVPIAEMAALCGMSESHFSREFHAAAGLPPHQYMLRLRLERAAQALLDSGTPVADIAQAHGFSSASHFSRVFALRYGQPPASYRRNSLGSRPECAEAAGL
jgi:AraC family transcriptional regulator